ncbi:sodium- and chloride-dependent GABA transporter 1-like protein, partial [Dinothrombium tinctorium]
IIQKTFIKNHNESKLFAGAFLVPFFLCILLCGIPLFLMEVSLGQYLNTGGIGIWNLVPVMKGIGYASMTMIGLCNIYYIVLIAWTLFYFVASFNFPLPWQSCGNPWNSEKCVVAQTPNASLLMQYDNVSSSVKEYWEYAAFKRLLNRIIHLYYFLSRNRVLAITQGIDQMGHIRVNLLICLLVAWILVYVVIWRGIHQSGKIIWFTATFPYVILLILFFRGVTLEGASKGLLFYISPKWSKLLEAKVWVSAATQVLFSYGIGIGANVALGSYNRFHHNFYRDSFLACCISSGTSLFSGIVIFSVLGHMAHITGREVSEVAKSGPGLAFIAYPEVVVKLPLAPFWAVLFFLMLIILGTDSQFCTVEAFVTGIVDEYADYLRPRRKIFTLLVVIIKFLLGIPLIMQGGMYVFQLMDFFSASGFSLLIVVFCEIMSLSWIFGAKKICENMETMLGFKPVGWFYYCWLYIAPTMITGIFIFSLVRYEKLTYADNYTYPWYGEFVGWCMALASILWIPGYALYYLLKQKGPLSKVYCRWQKGITSVVPPRKEKDNVYIDDDSSSADI